VQNSCRAFRLLGALNQTLTAGSAPGPRWDFRPTDALNFASAPTSASWRPTENAKHTDFKFSRRTNQSTMLTALKQRIEHYKSKFTA